jgi:hypothetical protein
MIFRIMGIIAMTLILHACATNPTTTTTYTPSQLRTMIQNGDFPKQGSQTTKTEIIGYRDCLAKVAAIIAAIGPNYPTRTILNTNAARMEKIWTNDGNCPTYI